MPQNGRATGQVAISIPFQTNRIGIFRSRIPTYSRLGCSAQKPSISNPVRFAEIHVSRSSLSRRSLGEDGLVRRSSFAGKNVSKPAQNVPKTLSGGFVFQNEPTEILRTFPS
jgi:hypothetical protein